LEFTVAPESPSQVIDNVPQDISNQTEKYPAFIEFSFGDSLGTGDGMMSQSDMQTVVNHAINWWNSLAAAKLGFGFDLP